MTRVTHTAALAVCYFIVPFALYLGLVAIGAFTGYLFITNLTISILSLVGLFAALSLILRRKSYTKALALICSISLINIWVWRFGENPIRRDLYMAEVLMTPNFDEKCRPPNGVSLNGDTLRVCSTHDFGDYADLIVKISGSYPTEHLIDDINSAKLDPATAGNELGELHIWRNSVTGQNLLADYYLLKVYVCGKGRPFCGPLQ